MNALQAKAAATLQFCRVGQNFIYAPCMTVHMVISLPKMPCTLRAYVDLADPAFLAYQNMSYEYIHVCFAGASDVRVPDWRTDTLRAKKTPEFASVRVFCRCTRREGF
jgi:hypothetical protein